MDFSNSEHSNQKHNTKIMLEEILSVLPEHIYWKDVNGVILGCNDQQAKSVGLNSYKEMIGKTPYDTLPKKQADLIHKADMEIISNGKAITTIEKSIKVDGALAIYRSTKTPLFDDDGNIIGLVGVSVDITELKKLQSELKAAEAREKSLKTLSALGGMVAHELRTPLLGIDASISTYKETLPLLIDGYKKYYELSGETPPIKATKFKALEQSIDQTTRAVNHAKFVVNDVLSSFHQLHLDDNPNYYPVDLYQTIETALSNYPEQDKIKQLITLLPFNATVNGDERLLVLIFHNLIKNALHAIYEINKGKITIRLEEDENNIFLYVKDTAKGIAPENITQIFEPFFTTKKNTAVSIGIGLFFCQVCIERMGGKIYCDSVVGEYTEFCIKLPKIKKNK